MAKWQNGKMVEWQTLANLVDHELRYDLHPALLAKAPTVDAFFVIWKRRNVEIVEIVENIENIKIVLPGLI